MSSIILAGNLPDFVAHSLGWQSKVFFAFEIIFSSVGIVANLIVFFVLLQTGIRNQSSYNFFILLLTFIDTGFHITVLWEVPQNIMYGGYTLGVSGCKTQAIMHELFGSSSLFLCLAIASERYSAIVKKSIFTNYKILETVALIAIPVLTLTLFPTISQTTDFSYALSVSRVICTGNWTSYQTYSIIHTALGLAIVFAGTIITFILYVLIYREMSVNHSREIPVSSGFSRVFENPTTPQQLLLNRKMLVQSITICLSLILAWTPFLISMIYQVSSGNQMSPEYDLFILVFVTIGTSLNGIIILALDRRVANRIKGMDIVVKVVDGTRAIVHEIKHVGNKMTSSTGGEHGEHDSRAGRKSSIGGAELRASLEH